MSLEFISLENVQEIAHRYGYWAVFLGILLENLGIPIPGETITIAGGFLAGSKELNYWLVLGSAIAGASVGGNFGYWIGRYGGWPLLVNIGKVFRISEEKLAELRIKFSENAGKTVFIGRFISLLRMFAGPLAGIVEMPYPKFMVYNVAGATAWGTLMVTLSFFAGKLVPLEQVVAWAAQFALIALVLLVAAIAVPIWLESRIVKQPESGD
jgi:membrane protein DedA with SNARE-associated domain